MAEGNGLLNRRVGIYLHRGFESRPLRFFVLRIWYCASRVILSISKAYKAFSNYDKSSAFLGCSKSESDKWIAEIQNGKIEKNCEQLKMF